MKEQDLRDKFKRFVNGYVGSSMLTNTEYPETIEANADKCVQIAKDYAEQEAIEFAEWMHENTVKDAKFYTVILDVVRYNQTLTECYQIFKNRENER